MAGWLTTSPQLVAWGVDLEYLPWWKAALLFGVLALPIVLLSIRSLAGLGPVRRWVAMGVRLLVLLVLVLLVAGVRWQRDLQVVEAWIVQDISGSTALVRDYPGKNLREALTGYVLAVAKDKEKRPTDRIGLITFNDLPLIDAMANVSLNLETKAIREPGGSTDIAAALQLAMAMLRQDAMHRLLLISDGNHLGGDLEPVLAAAAAQGIPIDVMPLRYEVVDEVLVERLDAPTWRRENEPFSVDVRLRSNNVLPVEGKLTLLLGGVKLEERQVSLRPGSNVERFRVPAMRQAGMHIHQFEAIFEPANLKSGPNAVAGKPGDTILENNRQTGFTFVRGRGRVLYVDGVGGDEGQILVRQLRPEGIELERVSVEDMPTDLVSLQNFDAVILSNIRRDAMTPAQDRLLAAYVHELGGGLVMVGGPDSFGAGAWQGSEVEKVLPVNMDVPAQRQIPKGALVLIMHSCEMPNGNYWGIQCALKAIETLSSRDEVGVVSFGPGRSIWDYPLQVKGDGSKAVAAVKQMALGDMPSFDECMVLALKGANAAEYALAKSDARQKHVIIISDGDPAPPSPQTIAAYRQAKVTVSTVSVYPHGNAIPPTMAEVARDTGGRSYGPIDSNFNQLPQIFIKEASVIRRSLIYEEKTGIPVAVSEATSDIVRGIQRVPPVYGMVLTTRKPVPQVEVPLVAGKNKDPLLARWQTGLGKAVAFTSDAHNKWAAGWVATPDFGKFWAQLIRSVARPPMSSELDVRTQRVGEKVRVTVEALSKDSAFLNFLSISGKVIGPGGEAQDIRLVQTGPGTYAGEFEAGKPGNYVTILNYRGPRGESGMVLGGAAVSESPELRELKSNEPLLRRIAESTGGRLLDPFDAANARLFTRQGLRPGRAPLPVWDLLIPVVVALILVDVATRRIAWDWLAVKRAGARVAESLREFTLARRVETASTVDALRRVREEGSGKPGEPEAPPVRPPPVSEVGRPDPRARFQARGVEGDITQVVGGATDKPLPSAPKDARPKGAASAGPGAHTESLLEAKRRAREQMKRKEEEGQ